MPRPGLIVLALLVLQAALVLLFVVPARSPEPHGLPVGVAGPAAAAAPAQRALAARGDAFEVHTYAAADVARAAIREREIYGALVPAEGRVLVASAASPVVAQQLRELGARSAAADATTGAPTGGSATVAGTANSLHVEDVVPAASGDPRGAVLNLLFLPLMIACFPLAAVLGRMRLPRRKMLGLVAGFAVLSGLGLTATLQAMDALPGPYLAVSGVAALVVAAAGLTAAGLFRVLGPAGLGIAALLFVVLGNPGSGNATAPELLPGFWRVAGQLLPPGAGGQALRDVAYFDGHALLVPAIVLAAWALFGAALLLTGRRRERPAPEPAPAPVPRIAVPV